MLKRGCVEGHVIDKSPGSEDKVYSFEGTHLADNKKQKHFWGNSHVWSC